MGMTQRLTDLNAWHRDLSRRVEEHVARQWHSQERLERRLDQAQRAFDDEKARIGARLDSMERCLDAALARLKSVRAQFDAE